MKDYIREPTYEVSFLFRRILVPIDGSASSMKALDVALDFSKRYGSRVTVLIVHDGLLDTEEIRSKIEKKISKAGVNTSIKTISTDMYRQSVPSKIIEESIEGDYDLVILSARGRTVSEDIVIGSTALSVIINTPVSVLLIR